MGRRGMTFIAKYVLFWTVFGLLVVSIIVLHKGYKPMVKCIDGNYSESRESCPVCFKNTDCRPDTVCQKGKCIAKPCISDSDCDGLLSQCIFEKCLPSGNSNSIEKI